MRDDDEKFETGSDPGVSSLSSISESINGNGESKGSKRSVTTDDVKKKRIASEKQVGKPDSNAKVVKVQPPVRAGKRHNSDVLNEAQLPTNDVNHLNAQVEDMKQRQMKVDKMWTKLKGVGKVVGAVNAAALDTRAFGVDEKDITDEERLSQDEAILAKKKWYIIGPGNRRKKVWDGFIVVLLLYIALALPVQVAYFEIESVPVLASNIIIDLIFLADIVLTFVTSFRHQQVLIIEPRQIALKYLKGWFLVDLVATFPVYLLNPTTEDTTSTNINKLSRLVRLPRIFKFARFIRLIKVLRVLRLNDYWTMLQNTLNVDQSVMRLGKFFFWTILGVHFCSCVWFFISMCAVMDLLFIPVFLHFPHIHTLKKKKPLSIFRRQYRRL